MEPRRKEGKFMLNAVKKQAQEAAEELIEVSRLPLGSLMVVGCSSSEVLGERIGTHSSEDVGRAIFEALYETTSGHGILLAAQCCEHLNRALIVDRKTAERFDLDIVNVIPMPKAGGSFATAAYHGFRDPVVVESLRHKASAGLDIGATLIGMHLKPVIVPLRLKNDHIGQAMVIAARTRPKFVGGSRAVYDENLL